MKHFKITQLFDDNRGCPPNTEIIDRKCLKCDKVKTEYRFT